MPHPGPSVVYSVQSVPCSTAQNTCNARCSASEVSKERCANSDQSLRFTSDSKSLGIESLEVRGLAAKDFEVKGPEVDEGIEVKGLEGLGNDSEKAGGIGYGTFPLKTSIARTLLIEKETEDEDKREEERIPLLVEEEEEKVPLLFEGSFGGGRRFK